MMKKQKKLIQENSKTCNRQKLIDTNFKENGRMLFVVQNWLQEISPNLINLK